MTSEDALRRLRDNPFSRWSAGVADDPAPGTAWHRINEAAFFTPGIEPGFLFRSGDHVFSLGSCFARRAEKVLARLGFQVDSITTAFDGNRMREGQAGRTINFMNKYNPASLLNELRWALDPSDPFGAHHLQQLDDDLWLDPHANRTFDDADLETTLARHRTLSDVVRLLPGCRVLILTLGLIESFIDTSTGRVTNSPPSLGGPDHDRFRFVMLTFEQCTEALASISDVLHMFGHPELEIVVTVSPVPLHGTFTGDDIVVANTLSKATLRAAAGWWATHRENVHYFPSYEVVMNSDRTRAWDRDGEHVSIDAVNHIMRLFAEVHGAAVHEGGPVGAH